jgi:hypothetical protein
MAKRIIRLTESQLRQIVGKVINEQAQVAPNPAAAAPAGPGPVNQDDMAIANELWRAVDGMGTYEDVWLTNTLKIADANQFWRVNAYLKQQHQNEDYASCLNGDFGDEDGEVVDNCVKHLAKIGIQATATINGTVFTEDSFKIVSTDPTPVSGATTTNTTNTTNATPKQQAINTVFCSVKDGKISTPGQLGDGSPWSGYTALYQITPQEIEAAKATCPDSELAKKPVVSERQTAINEAYCSVKNGKINLPGGVWNNTDWTMYSSGYSINETELATAKASCPDSELAKGPAVKPKAQWTKSNEQFPLKYGQFGAKIGEIQKDMGMSGDTYFGNTTEKGVLAKAPEYKRETGVTEDIFNKIKAASPTTAKAAPTPAAPAPSPTGDTTAAAPPPPTEAELQASPNTLNPY